MTATPDDASARADDGRTPLARVLSGLRNLGDNCEFGLVQRYAGLEPLSLFRFASAPLGPLIAALDDDFARYGAPGDLEIVVGYADHLTCISRACGFTHSTGEIAGSIDPAVVLRREERKVAYLKRLMLEELAQGEHLFVRKGPAGESLDDVRALVRAVRRHGPSTLLRVEAGGDDALGPVHRVEEGLLAGRVRRFSPYEGGMDIDLEPWIALSRNARWLADGHPGRPPPLALADRPLRAQGRARAHVTDRAAGTDAMVRTLPLHPAPEADAVYVLSLWVWLPADFRGERVFAVFDRQRLAWREADPACREAWQRIWISIRTPADPSRLRVGLGAVAENGQTFWSRDWRLTRGPVPAAGPAPTLPPERGWTRWLPGWG